MRSRSRWICKANEFQCKFSTLFCCSNRNQFVIVLSVRSALKQIYFGFFHSFSLSPFLQSVIILLFCIASNQFATSELPLSFTRAMCASHWMREVSPTASLSLQFHCHRCFTRSLSCSLSRRRRRRRLWKSEQKDDFNASTIVCVPKMKMKWVCNLFERKCLFVFGVTSF